MKSGYNQDLFLILTAKKLSGNAEQKELQDLENMLIRFPEAAAEYKALEATWNLLGDGLEDFQKEATGFNDHVAWRKVKENISKPKVVSLAGGSKPKQIIWMSLAASVLILITLGYFLFWNKSGELITIQGNELSKIEYYDGSEVSLSQDAIVSYNVDSSINSRTFSQTQGAAYYAVTKNPDKPFVVYAKLAKIQVLGTKFLVEVFKDSLVLSVEEGKVQAKSVVAKEMKIVNGGEKWVVKLNGDSHSGVFKPNSFTWANQQLKFSNTPLKEAINDIKFAYNVNIELDSVLNGCTISGSFSKKTVEEVLSTIAETLDLKVRRERNVFIISGKGC